MKILKFKLSRNANVWFARGSVVSLAMSLEEIEIKSCNATRGVSDNAGQPLANPRLVGAGQYKDEHARGKQAHLNSAYLLQAFAWFSHSRVDCVALCGAALRGSSRLLSPSRKDLTHTACFCLASIT